MCSFIAAIVWLTCVKGLVAQDALPVGRLERENGRAFCTASLITKDIAVTAAHCVRRAIGKSGAEQVNTYFRPSGKLAAERIPAVRVTVHPLYDRQNDPELWALRFDLALIKLQNEVTSEQAAPRPLGPSAEKDENLFLVSWRFDSDHPRQRRCAVLEGAKGLVTLGCRVRGGESGSPVFRQSEGRLEIVAVISSRSRMFEQPVAVASNLELRLRPMLDDLEGGP
ncbi:MAG: trypsin-like serine protease [Boseongicola sp.]|nr:trypsin-like serine protease [Boseongicola sp.]MDD9978545.1 trypsin-like serine protease [Boseongicola sp.]